MNLLINALLSNWKLIIFNDDRDILFEKNIEILWNESEKLIWYIDTFLSENKLDYNDLENIVVFSGPWSFTWIRTISLLVNTINFVINKNITSLSFFELYSNYPIIKSSSRRDSFFKRDINSEIEIISNIDVLTYLKENNIKKIYWENKNITEIEIFEKIDYSAIIKNIEFKNEKRIEPIYIKKPSIW